MFLPEEDVVSETLKRLRVHLLERARAVDAICTTGRERERSVAVNREIKSFTHAFYEPLNYNITQK